MPGRLVPWKMLWKRHVRLNNDRTWDRILEQLLTHVAGQLDEMHSPRTAQELCRTGQDVVAPVAEPSQRAMSDAGVFDWAAEQGRRVGTENVKDFRVLVTRSSRPSTGGWSLRRPGHVPPEAWLVSE